MDLKIKGYNTWHLCGHWTMVSYGELNYYNCDLL